ncbi:MFS transporter [Paenibacillus hexagrammi]|uniref:MFS transporter n=1 Tax=Paenibacillus hexagrammi TaxID=2908839 RepID=A0ABY3SGT0_9BACL|nr:MFS transporter [Paenibacillus sp. YPD9-1]UJF32142.1 MFS transporter [Paenibacillus sp. YPD9-1]
MLRLLLSFFAAMAATVLLLPWSMAVTFVFIAGISFGLVESSISTFVLLAAKEQQAIAFSKLEVFFGVGALIMPLISSVLIAAGAWKYAFLLLGGSSLAMAVIWSKLSLGEHDQLLAHKAKRDQPSVKLPRLSKRALAVLLMFMFVFFVYAGMENTIVNFLPSMFKEQMQLSSSMSSLTVTAYWLTMVIGRIFAGVIAEKLTYFRYLAVSYALSLLMVLWWVFNSSAWSGFAIVLLLGLFMSGMFAVALIYANQLLPGRTEQTTSFLIASGGLGGAVLPLASGWSLDRFHVSATVSAIAVGMLVVLLVVLYAKRLKEHPQTAIPLQTAEQHGA